MSINHRGGNQLIDFENTDCSSPPPFTFENINKTQRTTLYLDRSYQIIATSQTPPSSPLGSQHNAPGIRPPSAATTQTDTMRTPPTPRLSSQAVFPTFGTPQTPVHRSSPFGSHVGDRQHPVHGDRSSASAGGSATQLRNTQDSSPGADKSRRKMTKATYAALRKTKRTIQKLTVKLARDHVNPEALGALGMSKTRPKSKNDSRKYQQNWHAAGTARGEARTTQTSRLHVAPEPVFKPITEFHCFNKLPVEVRCMIWAEALPGPRAVTITASSSSEPCRIFGNRHHPVRVEAWYEVPILHRVCAESRYVLQTRYALAFGAQLGGTPVYFDYKRDVLFFPNPYCLVHFYGNTLPAYSLEKTHNGYKYDMSEVHENVQNLAFGKVHSLESVIGAVANQFVALKHLYLDGAHYQKPNSLAIINGCLTGETDDVFGWAPYMRKRSKELGTMPMVHSIESPGVFNKVMELNFEVPED